MRETCQVMLPGGPCGKPAVDYLEGGYLEGGIEYEDRLYLCVDHWDEFDEFTVYPDDDVDFDVF